MNGKDPLRYFRVEAREITEQLALGARELGEAVAPPLIAKMMRLTHTLKGAAAVVKQRVIAERTHSLEDALASLREYEGVAPLDAIQGINRQVAALEEAVATLDKKPAPAPAKNGTQTIFEESIGVLSAEAREIDALIDGIASARIGVRGLRKTVATIEHTRELAELVADWAVRSRTQGIGSEAAPRIRKFTQDLRNLLAETEQSLRNGIDQNERDLAEAHGAAEQLRLMPCSVAFAAFDRAVQDSAQSIGKLVTLSVRGGSIRLDPQVLGLIRRVLVQLLRNAVAHGIELPKERLAAGKNEAGNIAIDIVRRVNRIIVSCSDDGAGINLRAVRDAAMVRGLPIGDGGEAALLDLLLTGGVSTSDAVTEAAGRGVGLDVVRETTGRLGGQLSASTTFGRGTRIELSVPIRLSSLDALLVEAGGTSVAIPLEAVRKAIRVAPGDIARSSEAETIVHDGESIRISALSRIMRLPSEIDGDGPRPAIIVMGDDSCVAFQVDAISGTANLVVHALPQMAFADPVASGAWFDAGGAPRPVADVEALIRAAGVAGARRDTAKPKPDPVLVIDDSLTTRVLEQSILESAGFEVDLATCAEEGLEMARKRRYGLFLVDVEMPGMDGFTFVETTRADPELSQVPAILVSSRAAQEDIDRGLGAGAHAYFIKSEFDQREVLDTIRRLLEN